MATVRPRAVRATDVWVLTHTGRFEAELTRLGSDPGTPSAVDALGLYFVERHTENSDALIAAVAATECG